MGTNGQRCAAGSGLQVGQIQGRCSIGVSPGCTASAWRLIPVFRWDRPTEMRQGRAIHHKCDAAVSAPNHQKDGTDNSPILSPTSLAVAGAGGWPAEDRYGRT